MVRRIYTGYHIFLLPLLLDLDHVLQVPSPIIRSLIWTQVATTIEGAPIPRVPPPFIVNGAALDVVSLLKTSLLAFDPSLFRNAIGASYKMASLPGLQDVPVPQEAVYQSELQRILRSWLPARVAVLPQANAGSLYCCDIVIVPHENHKILLELVASAPLADIKEHFRYGFFIFPCICFNLLSLVCSRAREYGKSLGIKEVWVVHFTLKEGADDFPYPFPDASLGVKVMHVWHNFEFTAVSIRTAEVAETLTLPLSND